MVKFFALIIVALVAVWLSPYRDVARSLVLSNAPSVQRLATQYSVLALNKASELSEIVREKTMQLLREELHSTIETKLR